MPHKVFITGVTGYIGGDALFALTSKYPDLEYTALVRQSPKVAQVAAQYPSLRLVYGDLDSSALLTDEAKKADIVLHTASIDHSGAIHALFAGLLARDTPGYYLHVSGTGSLVFNDTDRHTYGESATKTYDDWDGLAEVTSLPPHALHVPAERLVRSYAAKGAAALPVRAAIVAPPCIYGLGRGPGNTRSVQIPLLAKAVLQQRQGLQFGKGMAAWSGVHVADLSEVWVALVGKAVDARDASEGVWGAGDGGGFYFAADGEEVVWGEVARELTREASKHQGWIGTDEMRVVSAEEADSIVGPSALMLLGTNSRSKAERARKLLGWKPEHSHLSKEIPRALEAEAKALGMVVGHAAKAAGDA